MKKILLIGGTGFLGLNLVKYVEFFSKNYQIVVFSKSSTDLIKLPNFCQLVIGDYHDKDTLNDLFLQNKFDWVFHFVSSIIPAVDAQNIQSDIEMNLLPTIQLLEIMKKHRSTKILFLSSGGAVYGNHFEQKVSEELLCKPISSYGIIKLTTENFIELYGRLENIDFLILRLSNPFGYFHTSEKQGIVNIAIRKALKNQTIMVWGDGNQKKDYISAQDVCQAIIKLIESNVKNEIINIGSGSSLNLNQILEKIREKIPAVNWRYTDSKLTDVNNICLDIKKLQSIIDYQITPFDKALTETIAFEKSRL